MNFEQLKNICKHCEDGGSWRVESYEAYKKRICPGFGSELARAMKCFPLWKDPVDQSIENLCEYIRNGYKVCIKGKPSYRSWDWTEVPIPCVVRRKDRSHHNERWILEFSYSDQTVVFQEVPHAWSLKELFHQCEYSIDLKTWHPCGKVIT